jgi:hypothetical protein
MAIESSTYLRKQLNDNEQLIQKARELGNEGLARVLERRSRILSRKLDLKK